MSHPMKYVFSAGAVACLAGSALGAVGTVSLTASSLTVNPGEAVTIGLVLDDDGTTPGVMTFDIAVTPTGGGFSYVEGSLTPLPLLDIFQGGDGADNLVTMYGGSPDILGPTFDAPLNGLTVFTFQIMFSEEQIGTSVTLETSDGPTANPPLHYAMLGEIVHIPVPYEIVEFNSVTIRVVPAPSAPVLFALVGVLSAGRRGR